MTHRAVCASMHRRSERYMRLKELYEFQQRLVELRLCTTDGRSWSVELLQESTLQAAIERARSTMPAQAEVDGGSDPYSAAGGAVEWRLRHFSPMTGRAGQTFAADLLDSSLVSTNSSHAIDSIDAVRLFASSISSLA
jgi:hypothetical protein